MTATLRERVDVTGEMTPSLPATCPILIGRAGSLGQLLAAAAQAAEGQGQIALVSGDAGIGKSRLLEEARIRLGTDEAQTAPGFLVLEGRCFEEDRHFPYAPLLDLLRRHPGVARHDQVASLLPGLDEAAAPAAPRTVPGAERAKRRLQEGLLHVLTDQTRHQPVAVIVEDVHWSDDASLEFLQYLARYLATQPILLVLTYRDSEVSPGLARLLAALFREQRVTQIPLARLSSGDVEEMLRAIFDQRQPIDPDFLQTIYRLTEGNPFFVEETLRSLVAAGDTFFIDGRWDRKPLEELHIPRAVRVAVQRRLSVLREPARQLLALAAVAGRRFDANILKIVSGMDEATLVAAIKELIAAQFVVEETADVFSFRHALIREAVYRNLLTRERRALHASLAEVIERLEGGAGGASAADLVHHYEQAGDWKRVLTCAVRAGEQALDVYALGAAITHSTRALDASERLATPRPLMALRLRGWAHELSGHFQEALADYDMTLEMARAVSDGPAEWQSLVDLASVWAMRDVERAGQYSRDALTLARKLTDPDLLTQSLNSLGSWYARGDQPSDAERCHEEAEMISRRRGHTDAAAEALLRRGESYFQMGDQREGTRYMARAAELFERLGERVGYAYCRGYTGHRAPTYLSTVSPWIEADLVNCVRDIEEALIINREVGRKAGEAFCDATLAYTLGPHGDYASALPAAQRGLDIATEISHGPMIMANLFALSALYLDLLAPSQALAVLEQDRPAAIGPGSVSATRQIAAVHASAYIAEGDLVAAWRELDHVSDPDMPCVTLSQRHLWYVWAELALASGRADESLRIIDRLIAALPAETTTVSVVPRLWTLRGRVLGALGEPEKAVVDLRAAVDAARVHGVRPLLWRAQAELARACLLSRRRGEAEDVAREARETIRDLADAIVDEDLRTIFLQAALGQVPAVTPPTPNQAAKQRFGGLTARERQVAALLRHGLSNRAAGDTLVLSERTVERHVANIMAKLGVGSRSQIAVWATEQGLTDPGETEPGKPRAVASGIDRAAGSASPGTATSPGIRVDDAT